MNGLNMYEVDALKAARKVLASKPDEALRYLAGDNPLTKALVALALSAQLEVTKQKLAGMQLTIALCEFLKVGKEKEDAQTND
jgi:hypothetical protein